MTTLLTALALAAAHAPAAVQPAAPAIHSMPAQQAQHAQPAKPGAKASSDGCPCCNDMAGSGKMGCCAKHGEAHGAEHSDHSPSS